MSCKKLQAKSIKGYSANFSQLLLKGKPVDNYSWFIEKITKKNVGTLQGPFEVSNKDFVNLYSDTINIDLRPGSVLLGMNTKYFADYLSFR